MIHPLLLSLALAASAQADTAEVDMTVTTTRIAEDVDIVPAAVTVISGKDLRDKGVADLRTALETTAGVEIAPGGDNGPAGSVPEFWGLREADAFLLVVDGVPWGGAFNPNLRTLSLQDVDRIEVIRGAAPVMYGATSFVGVIQVIHTDPALTRRSVTLSEGNRYSHSIGLTLPLGQAGGMSSALEASSQHEGFKDARTSFDRDHVSWRGKTETGLGTLELGLQADSVRQAPASPRLVEGDSLSSNNPVDANYNPAGAYLDEDRGSARASLKRSFSDGTWTTTLAPSQSNTRALRGFLVDITTSPDAHGFRETIGTTDLYFDSHVQWDPADRLKLVAGVDHLHGDGLAHGGDFDYQVDLLGAASPAGGELPSQAAIHIFDRREFSGLYGFGEWTVVKSVVFEGGARLNRMEEWSHADSGKDHRMLTHGSGSAALTWKALQSEKGLVSVYGDYRNTFKPAAVDFGLDSSAQILAPETAQSYEAGVKTRWFDGRIDADLSAFQMDFKNVVVPTEINGNPALENAGQIRLKGIEVEVGATPVRGLRWKGAYSLHDARFVDLMETQGGVSTDLRGNFQEQSPRDMASTSLTYSLPSGWLASVNADYVGKRYMDRENTALAKAYVTWGAGVGYRTAGWEARLDGRNLNDQRPPVSVSELGGGQQYLLPSLRADLTLSLKF